MDVATAHPARIVRVSPRQSTPHPHRTRPNPAMLHWPSTHSTATQPPIATGKIPSLTTSIPARFLFVHEVDASWTNMHFVAGRTLAIGLAHRPGAADYTCRSTRLLHNGRAMASGQLGPKPCDPPSPTVRSVPLLLIIVLVASLFGSHTTARLSGSLFTRCGGPSTRHRLVWLLSWTSAVGIRCPSHRVVGLESGPERTSDGRERATKPSHLCLVDEVGVML